ncbi:MAG: glycosyltransferase family 4 protein [Endomicrobiales bacterium]
MNICLLSKSHLTVSGGIESYTGQMAAALSALGHQVHIVARGTRSGATRISPGVMVHQLAFRELSFPGSWRLDKSFPLYWLAYSWLVSRRLCRIIREHKVDLVESPNWGLEGYWYCLRRRIPVVVRLHVPTPDYARLGILPSKLRARTVLRLERSFASRADAVSAPSRYLAEQIRREYGLSRKIAVVPNGVSLERFPYDPDAESAAPTVLYVGRLEENKGVGCLLEAIPRILEMVPEAECILAGRNPGDPAVRKAWEKFAHNTIASGRVRLTGELPPEEVRGLYQRCWVCVVPSLSEAFGLTAVEAMACGRPVVAAAAGGLGEIVEQGLTGILVPPSDPGAIARSVVRLLRDRELRRRLGKKARAAAERRFDAGRSLRMTLEVYEEAVRGFPRRAGAAPVRPGQVV